ncbi:MAG TPA: hypothetical protein VKU86_04425 [Acidimicrobiales bacterium]|nr:hypothetical protein [Acidimicrobiales bacterium]
MRKLVRGRTGLVALGGLLFAAVIGPTVVPEASSAQSGRQSSASSPPCASASYVLAVSGSGQATQGWSLAANGQVDFINDAATANVTLPTAIPIPGLAGSDVQLVLVGGTAYASVPPALSGFVGGAPWVSVALPSSLDTVVNSVFPRLAAWCGNGQSVVSALGRHRGTSLGSTSIGGEPVTGTQIRSSSSKVSRALGLPRGVGRARHGGVPVDVWDNGQGQLTALSVTLPSLSISLQLTNIDQPVSITAPTGAVPLSPSILSMIGGFAGARAAG